MFTIGTDPELFLFKDGKLISAIPLIDGRKHDPISFSKYESLIHDNIALEVTTTPAKTCKKFVANIRSVLQKAQDHIGASIEMRALQSLTAPDELLDNEEARIFGCDISYSGWDRNPIFIDPEAPFKPFRSCGGHVHIGLPKKTIKKVHRALIARVGDLYLGVPFVILEQTKPATDRRKLYGTASDHRPTSYGIEYRSLSNYWIASPKLVEIVFELTKTMVEKLGSKDDIVTVVNAHEKDIVSCLNTNSYKKAVKLMKILEDNISKELYDAIMHDESLRSVNLSVTENWRLTDAKVNNQQHSLQDS